MTHEEWAKKLHLQLIDLIKLVEGYESLLCEHCAKENHNGVRCEKNCEEKQHRFDTIESITGRKLKKC